MAKKIKVLAALLKQPGVGSGDLTAALEEARGEMEGAVVRLAAADEAYHAGLLDCEDEQLSRIQEERTLATMRRDRTRALVSGLEAKLLEARETEAEAAFQAEVAAVEAEAEAVGNLVREHYPRLAADLVALLMRIDRADAAVAAMNRRLVEVGRSKQVLKSCEVRALPAPASTHATEFSIWRATTLGPIPGMAPGWDVGDRVRSDALPAEEALWTKSKLWRAGA